MMTLADVVASAMAGESGDLLRDAVALVLRGGGRPADGGEIQNSGSHAGQSLSVE
jgi:hypothetical protein